MFSVVAILLLGCKASAEKVVGKISSLTLLRLLQIALLFLWMILMTISLNRIMFMFDPFLRDMNAQDVIDEMEIIGYTFFHRRNYYNDVIVIKTTLMQSR